jgi:adenylosuccinate lyase
MKEMDEPFEANQVGLRHGLQAKSHAKRAHLFLGRYVMTDLMNRRLPPRPSGWSVRWTTPPTDASHSGAFLATDAILLLYINVVSGLTVYPQGHRKAPAGGVAFYGYRDILMHCVKAGGDRQKLHEASGSIPLPLPVASRRRAGITTCFKELRRTAGSG